ncbi:MAG TPA: GyrI-like domain-containing protein [Verrucomicrobiales bacterium]|nr:GyrI-like domain-containing protein [Verrucomicrobiales bacterium]
MDLEIREDLVLQVHGYSGMAVNGDYAGAAFRLMDRMWSTVRRNDLKHKGLNIHVYGPDEEVFAGVELVGDQAGSELESKTVSLTKYAWFKHTGPYNLIRTAGAQMRNELNARGFETNHPYIEIYGHWTADEAKLETELLMNLSAP